MSLYFDNVIEGIYKSAINTHISWHPQASSLAVAAYTEDKGGTITVYTGEGKLNEDVDVPPHPTAQVTAVVWHPVRNILAVGWESGELFLWNNEEHELHEIQSLHRAPISILEFSIGGKRLVSGDTSGSLVGWSVDNMGNLQTVFSHELKDSLAQIVFRVSVASESSMTFDLSELAKAAVNGDERALDIFSSWRPKTGHKRVTNKSGIVDNANFFLGSTSGVLYHVNESGECVEVLQAEGGIKCLLHHGSRNLLVLITEILVLGQFSVSNDGAVSEITKAKLSGKSSDIQVTWAGLGTLAVSTGDGYVRLWEVDSGDNFVLDLGQGLGYRQQEHILCLSYSYGKRILCAGTNFGNIAMWKFEENDDYNRDPESQWKLQPPTILSGAVTQITWGSSMNLLAANTVREVYVLNEQNMAKSFKDRVCVVQTAPSQLSITIFGTTNKIELKSQIQIRGLCTSMDNIIVWNSKEMIVYEINADASRYRIKDSFACEVENAVLHSSNIYTLEANCVVIRSLQGTVKQKLTFTESEGQPTSIGTNGDFLVVGTLLGTVKMWDLSRREAKLHNPGKHIDSVVEDFGEIISVQCNCKGTKVSITIAQSSLMPDPKIYFWDLDSDSVIYFNFATGRIEDDDVSSDSIRSAVHQDRSKREMAKEIAGRYVTFHMWDPEDSQLLVCEANLLKKGKKQKKAVRSRITEDAPKPNSILVSMFVSSHHGVVVQETFPLTPSYLHILGLQVPYFYLINSSENQTDSEVVTEKVMRDFRGLEDADKATKDAMLNFSLFLSLGNIDEAFKSIKTIKSEAVWENMAKMCVKTRRLDVAYLCLGNMGHARGARALRLAEDEPELDAKIGILALQLGMIDDAEKLFQSCSRYDLVNKMYQAAGIWSKAVECAEKDDRIHLRSTHYNYAKHLENKGDLSGAINHYEKSDTYRFEVPRMLFDELPTLEDYIMHTDDRALRRWWAQYLESTGEMETALQFYEAASDNLSLVRVYCYCNNLEKAAQIAQDTGDRAACYHLARQYENVNKVKEAISFFSRAQAYGNAIRICKENGYDDQMLNLALMAGPNEQIEAARYFSSNNRRQINKAVMLYHKAGLVSKAVDLAFKSGQVGIVAQIAMELDDTADPVVLERCSQYFISINQYDKAVKLLLLAKKFYEALDLCVERNVQVTEELAEMLTLPKDENTRNQILEKVAECAYIQGNYKLATKKFTQAGNKVKAMKCLLKSGDTDRIIYFANVCRQPDIYIMAGNYLQSLDYRQNEDIMSNIIQFYSRAKAYLLLVEFYDSTAQIEIDEYQNYEKAEVAFMEALKYLKNAEGNTPEGKVLELQYKLEKVNQFVRLKRGLSTDYETALSGLFEMMDDSGIEKAVRQGDVFAVIIEHQIASGNHKAALSTLHQMRDKLPKVNPSYYIRRGALIELQNATGVTLISTKQDDDQVESDEDFVEEVDDDPEPSAGFKPRNDMQFL